MEAYPTILTPIILRRWLKNSHIVPDIGGCILRNFEGKFQGFTLSEIATAYFAIYAKTSLMTPAHIVKPEDHEQFQKQVVHAR